ncbi:MAG TPA: NrfD/PsrC family molybdoenzyme membrane anchor subunit [Dehalococcoidia bacterium]|nr:NrfD/PsrC family molybdoenzyme membrane anchor subunit [Dehalococcoidia bacterium]
MDGFIYPNEAELQWSILIVLYPFITGLVAGAFVVSSLYHVFGIRVLRPVARMALVTALAFLLIAPLPLQAHLGRPERAFLIFLTPHFTSAMAGFGFIWLCYLILVVVETWLVFRADIVRYAAETQGPLRLVYRALTLGVEDVSEEALEMDHRVVRVLAGVGIPAAALLHGYVGFIFGAIKANPWWSTPLMPVIFLLSAIVSGMALLMVLYALSMKLLHRRIDHDCMKAMATWLFGFLFIDLALEGLEILSMAYEAEESWEIVRGLFDRIAVNFFGIQLLLGAVVPLLLLGYVALAAPSRRVGTAIAAVAAALVVVGVFAMRWNVVVGGQLISKSLRGYVEYQWIWGGREGVFMAGFILTLPFFLFAALVKLLPPWTPAEAPAEAREPEPAPAFAAPSAPYGWPVRRAPTYAGVRLTLGALAAVAGTLFLGVLALPGEPGLLEFGSAERPQALLPTRQAFPARLVQRIYEPLGGSWVEPLDVAVMDGRVFVLDHNLQQIVEVDPNGRLVRAYNARTTPGLELRHPHTIASDGRYLYIGNTFPPRVYVLDPDGGLRASLPLPRGPVEGVSTVPTGMALEPDGSIVISDGQNHRLIQLTPSGDLVRTIVRPPGSWQLAMPQEPQNAMVLAAAQPLTSVSTMGRPGSVGVAANGDLLALDVLGPGVARVRPDGEPVRTFARPDDPVGGVFRPADVAVDGQGRIYVADDLIGAVQVYSPEGEPLGLLGRADPNSFRSSSDAAHPSGLAVEGNRLYVVDRGRGVLVYELP